MTCTIKGRNGFTSREIGRIVEEAQTALAAGGAMKGNLMMRLRAAAQDAGDLADGWLELSEENPASDSFASGLAEANQLHSMAQTALRRATQQLEKDRGAASGAPISSEHQLEPYSSPTYYDPNAYGSGSGAGESVRVIRGVEDRRFGAMFPTVGQSDGGFRNVNEFMGLVGARLNDSRLVAATTGNTGSSSDAGGWMIPTQFFAGLLDHSLEGEIVRPRADVVPMTTRQAEVPFWDLFDNSQSVGGLVGEWIGEGKARNETQAIKTDRLSLVTNKLGIFSKATNELLSDANGFDKRLNGALVTAIGWHFDYAYLCGDGVGKPLGVLKAPSRIAVPKEASQGAGTITYANLVKMFARMHPAFLTRAVWLVNPTAIPQLLLCFPTDGNGASSTEPVLKEGPNGNFTMFTRPVIFSEKVPAIGAEGDISLIDFSQYLIGLRPEGIVQTSGHVGWETDETHFRILVRADGRPKWVKPFTPKHGDPQSWCVTLAERA